MYKKLANIYVKSEFTAEIGQVRRLLMDPPEELSLKLINIEDTEDYISFLILLPPSMNSLLQDYLSDTEGVLFERPKRFSFPTPGSNAYARKSLDSAPPQRTSETLTYRGQRYTR